MGVIVVIDGPCIRTITGHIPKQGNIPALESDFRHVAFNPFIDEVAAQIKTAEPDHTPRALQKARDDIAEILKDARQYAHLFG